MNGKWMTVAALNGLIAVAAGAFGAHALKTRLAPADLAIFEVGARYQMYHALALLAVAAVAAAKPSAAVSAAGVCFALGIILFSGSLYGLSLLGWKWLGPITPIGGGLFLVGWGLLGWTGLASWETQRGIGD